MIRIEFKSINNEIKTEIAVEGKGSDIIDELVCFHKNNIDIQKGILDKLPPDIQFKALIRLLEQHIDVSEGDDEK